MDFGRKRHFDDSSVPVAQTVRPAFGENASNICFQDRFYYSLCQSSGIRDDNGAKADVNQFLFLGPRSRNKVGEGGRWGPIRGLVKEPISCDSDPIAEVEWGRNNEGTDVVEEGNFVGLQFVETGAAKSKFLLAPAINLASCRFPKDVIEHDIGDIIICATHFVFRDRKSVRVGSGACPGHGESSEVGNT